MTIQFADDFKGYGTNVQLMINGLYSAVGGTLINDPDPNAAGRVMFFSAFGDNLRRPLTGIRTKVGVAGRFWLNALLNTKAQLVRICDVSIAPQVGMLVTSVGGIQIWHGNAVTGTGTMLGETTGPVLTASAWNHVELLATDSGDGGTVEVRVNGVTKLALAGVNTGIGYAQVEWTPNDVIHGNADQPYYLKDIVVYDGLGTENNTFLGSVQVIGRTPTSDVTLNWTPSTGTTGWPLLDNSPPLDDTQYLTAPFPAPAASAFGLSPLPADVTSVKALITQCRVRNTDGGDGNFQASLISDGVTGNGADRPITSAFTYYEDVFEHDPNTNAPWTAAAATAAVLKINRTV